MIDKKIVEYISNLARVEVSEEEKGFLGEQLSQIIDYVDKLRELDVEGISPYRGIFSQDNALREDDVRVSPAREAILKNAPSESDGFFKIPKVIE